MPQPILGFRNIEKSFFGALALQGVSFDLFEGEVIGLVGENGAGKSTLVNLLGGNLAPDGGQMRRDGQAYAPGSPADAGRAGVSIVHQELNLFANLTIAENLLLANLPGRRIGGLGWIGRRTLTQKARELLQVVGLDVDPAAPVERLSPGRRQLVEIAKALGEKPRILVLDEPTTSLTQPEAQRLFEIIQRLSGEGVAVIYISHNLGDVLRLCDRVVVLRDGEVKAVGPKDEFDVPRIISLMVGRSLDRLVPAREPRPTDDTLLNVRGLTQPGVVENVSFALHGGEVLGLSGLMGSGRTELARILFGLDPYANGEIHVAGKLLARPSPKSCIRLGMAYLTEDRRGEGLLMEASAEENLSLASLGRFARAGTGLIRRRALGLETKNLVDALRIECRSTHQAAKTLSGGNQQKLVLGRWLMAGSRILILDEPTRGVDIGAKFEIYEQVNRLVAGGAGVLLISSELEELVGLCDRILIMSQGELQASVERDEFDRHEMLRSALGEERLK